MYNLRSRGSNCDHRYSISVKWTERAGEWLTHVLQVVLCYHSVEGLSNFHKPRKGNILFVEIFEGSGHVLFIYRLFLLVVCICQCIHV
jgi:hypothetical protein